MTTRTHLFLALGGDSWGETAFGIRVARQLHQQGDRILFCTHPASSRLLVGAEFPVEFIRGDEELQAALRLARDPAINLASIVLADENVASRVLSDSCVAPESWLQEGVPTIVIDTWDPASNGRTMDVGVDQTSTISGLMDAVPLRLFPVPFQRAEGQATRCRFLPSPIRVSHADRQRARATLGLAERDRAVLITTAPWQHLSDDPHDARIGREVPALLSYYLSQLGPSVHIVHVGPAAAGFDAFIGDRYHWLPTLTPSRFDLLMASVDLLLSLNAAATTMGRAIAADLPMLCVHNSIRGLTADDAIGALGARPSDYVRAWIGRTVPLYRFRVWPVGLFEFMAPLLSANPYCDTFESCDLLAESQVVHTCARLLFDADARDALIHRQNAYVKRLAVLPTPGEAITSFLESRR